MPGICTSTMRHEVSCSRNDFRKSSADSKDAARKPKDSMRNVVVLRMDSSSSTIEIKAFATSNSILNKPYCRTEKEAIGSWDPRLLKKAYANKPWFTGFFPRG